MTDSRKTAVIVAGMHRSGTSALARTVNLLGVDLPEQLVPGFSGNDLGHWEPEEVVAIHDAMLSVAGSDVNDVVGFDPAWLDTDSAREFKQRIVHFLELSFSRAANIAIKDPRICLFLPVWQDAMDRLGIDAVYMLPYRAPAEVAASLTRRQGRAFPDSVWPPERGGLLWLRHLAEAERHTRGRRRAFLSFDKLLADWRSKMRRVGDQLAFAWPAGLEANAPAIDAFLDRQHKHEAQAGLDPLPELAPYLDDLRHLEAEPGWTGHRFGDANAAAPLQRRYLNAYLMALETRNLELSRRAAAPTDDAEEASATFAYEALLKAVASGPDAAPQAAESPTSEAERLASALAAALRTSSGKMIQLRAQSDDRDQAARERITDLERSLAAARGGEAALSVQLGDLGAAHVEARQERDALERHADELARRYGLERDRRTAFEQRFGNVPTPWAALLAILKPRRKRRRDARAERIAASGLFDAPWYLRRNPDVAVSNLDPLDHFLRYGSAEGRDPGPRFSATRYLAAYPDCCAGQCEPLQHFLDHGRAEGRAIFPADAPVPAETSADPLP